MRTSPFWMQMSILIGMGIPSLSSCTCPPHPGNAAPRLAVLSLPTTAPYSNDTPRILYMVQGLKARFPKDPKLTAPRMLLETALQVRSWKAGENLIGQSRQPRRWVSENLSRNHTHTHPDSAPEVTAMEIEFQQASQISLRALEGGDNMITVGAKVESRLVTVSTESGGTTSSRGVTVMKQGAAAVAVVVRARATTMSCSVLMSADAPGLVAGDRGAGGLGAAWGGCVHFLLLQDGACSFFPYVVGVGSGVSYV